MSWDFNLLTHRQFPRQFEFNPSSSKEELVFGTLGGSVYHAAFDDGAAARMRNLGNFGNGKLDSILGLCWLRRDASRFVAGSSRGEIVCGDVRDGFNGQLPGQPPSAVAVYPSFNKLTSVHINSQNNFLVASGYTTSVRIYDLETAAVLHDYDGIHTNHINISRFANHAPFVFSTSSFDGTCKTFDLRMKPSEGGIYTCKCGSGVVMISYSPDDTFLLASALDNEITQFLALDGRRHSTLEVPRTGLVSNFTRAYYSQSGAYVYTGEAHPRPAAHPPRRRSVFRIPGVHRDNTRRLHNGQSVPVAQDPLHHMPHWLQ